MCARSFPAHDLSGKLHAACGFPTHDLSGKLHAACGFPTHDLSGKLHAACGFARHFLWEECYQFHGAIGKTFSFLATLISMPCWGLLYTRMRNLSRSLKAVLETAASGVESTFKTVVTSGMAAHA